MDDLTLAEIDALEQRCRNHADTFGPKHQMSGQSCWCVELSRALAMARRTVEAERALAEAVAASQAWCEQAQQSEAKLRAVEALRDALNDRNLIDVQPYQLRGWIRTRLDAILRGAIV